MERNGQRERNKWKEKKNRDSVRNKRTNKKQKDQRDRVDEKRSETNRKYKKIEGRNYNINERI